MALQVIVEVDTIVKRQQGGTLTLRLRLFAEGANPDTDAPVFEETASADIKGNVEGKTRQQLVNDATAQAGKELRAAALAYQRIVEYQSMVNTDTVQSAIEEALAG